MDVFVRRVYKDDQQQSALCFRGTKNAHCVLLGRKSEIRVWTMGLREAEKAAVPQYHGEPYPAKRMAKELQKLGEKNGITLAAERLLKAVLDGTVLTEEEIDVKPSENVVDDDSPPAADESPEKDSNDAPVKKKARKVKSATKPAETSEPKAGGSRGNLVAELSKKFGLEPKDARKALRKAGMSAPYNDAAKVEAVLAKANKK